MKSIKNMQIRTLIEFAQVIFKSEYLVQEHISASHWFSKYKYITFTLKWNYFNIHL